MGTSAHSTSQGKKTGSSTHSSTGTSMHSNASTSMHSNASTSTDTNRSVVIPMLLPQTDSSACTNATCGRDTRLEAQETDSYIRMKHGSFQMKTPESVTDVTSGGWQVLFEPCPFFYQYEHYLQLRLQAGSQTELIRWEGYVLSRLRKLIQALEYTGAVTYVHPYTNHRDDHEKENGSDLAYLHPQLHTTEIKVARESSENESVCCLYLGFELCPHWEQHAVAGAVNALVTPVLNYFIATELQYAKPQCSAMGVQAAYLPWAGLSFPNPTGDTKTSAEQVEKHKTELMEVHWAARNNVVSLQQIQWLHEQHQYEQQTALHCNRLV